MSEAYNIKKIFGHALRELREDKKLTQEKLAELLGLETYQTINRIENGKSFVTVSLLEKMCDFFEVSPAFFFTSHIQISEKDHKEYIDLIKQSLPTFSVSKLKEIYNILLIMQK